MVDTKKSEGRPRGRPRGFDEAEAVAKAEAIFRRLGYDGAGVADLCRETGLNPPSLYGAFGSKAGLYARALERFGETNGFAREAAAEPEIAGFVRAFLVGAARAYAPSEGRAGCLGIETARGAGDPEARATAEAGLETTRRIALARLAADPATAAEAEAVADALLVALTGLSGLARLGWSGARLEAAAALEAEALAGRIEARG